MLIKVCTLGISVWNLAEILEPTLGAFYASEMRNEEDDFDELYYVFEDAKIVLMTTYGWDPCDAVLITYEDETFTLKVDSIVHTGKLSTLASLLLELAKGYDTNVLLYD